jgi:hypothetical protein
VEKGIVNREKFYIPKELANGYNGAGIHFNITEERMKEK